MTNILIIRHGQTDWNITKRLQGHSNTPLNAVGLAQAQTLAQTLKDEAIDVIYSSDLLRAQQTAQAIATAHQLDLVITPTLRERCYGACEGLTAQIIKQTYPESYEAWYAADPDHFFPDGERKTESPRQFHERASQAILSIADKHAGKNIAIVTHFGVIETAYRLAQQIPLGTRCKMPVLNTSINRFKFSDNQLKLLVWGESSHLEEAKQPPVSYYKHF